MTAVRFAALSSTLPRRAGRLVLALAMLGGLALAGVPSPARADAKADLDEARARLSELQQRIAGQQQALALMHGQLTAIATRLGVATARYRTTQADIARTREDLRSTRERFLAIRRQLDDRTAASYMDGPGSILQIVLGANTFTDFTYRLSFLDSISRADTNLSQEVELSAQELVRKQQVLADVKAQLAGVVADLDRQREALEQKLAEQQAALDELSGARSEAAGLVDDLQGALQQEEILAATAAVNGGTPIPFGQWAPLFLPRLGAPTCQNNLVLVVAWAATEYTQARFNPLATSYPMPGATIFAGAVKNYVSLDQGIEATVLTLESTNPAFNYAPIVADLRACADPLVTAEAINHSAYCECSGSYPLTYLVPFVENNYEFYANICTGC
jgi:peptidoglycan hydrolase CwlO-like protein